MHYFLVGIIVKLIDRYESQIFIGQGNGFVLIDNPNRLTILNNPHLHNFILIVVAPIPPRFIVVMDNLFGFLP